VHLWWRPKQKKWTIGFSFFLSFSFRMTKQAIQFICRFFSFFFRLFHWSKNENEYLNHHFFHFTPLSFLHFIVFRFSILLVPLLSLSFLILFVFFPIMNRQNKLYQYLFLLCNMLITLSMIRYAIPT
jgi:hypothetical protein